MKKELDRPFFLRSERELVQLETWLRKRPTFNCGGFSRSDRNGNPMVTLGMDWNPSKDSSMPKQRGCIVVVHRASLPAVEALVDKIAAENMATPQMREIFG